MAGWPPQGEKTSIESTVHLRIHGEEDKQCRGRMCWIAPAIFTPSFNGLEEALDIPIKLGRGTAANIEHLEFPQGVGTIKGESWGHTAGLLGRAVLQKWDHLWY